MYLDVHNTYYSLQICMNTVLAIRDEFLKIKCELSFLLIKSFMHVSKNQIYESVRTNFFHRWDLFLNFREDESYRKH